MIKLMAICLCIFSIPGYVCSQTHSDEIIERTISKIGAINRSGRVVEKTFGDIIYLADSTVSENRLYEHQFRVGNTYHLNAFASEEDVSDINIVILSYDMNNKLHVVSQDNMKGNDVNIRFEPVENEVHYIVVTAALKSGVKNCFFNLIIDRE
jgi:spore cortex formation protein SpoVR/YcgB (stage V sporulation)